LFWFKKQLGGSCSIFFSLSEFDSTKNDNFISQFIVTFVAFFVEKNLHKANLLWGNLDSTPRTICASTAQSQTKTLLNPIL
jgi:hypothetical protein